MNPTQGKVLLYVGLIFILNTLFPPTSALNGTDAGRAWLWSDRKSINTFENDSSGKLVGKKQEVYIQVDLTRLVVSESLILGCLFVLLGFATDDDKKKKLPEGVEQ